MRAVVFVVVGWVGEHTGRMGLACVGVGGGWWGWGGGGGGGPPPPPPTPPPPPPPPLDPPPLALYLQVAKSVEYVQAGTTHLVAAKQLQKNTRKWMCCALILLLIIAAAIAIPIAIKLSK